VESGVRLSYSFFVVEEEEVGGWFDGGVRVYESQLVVIIIRAGDVFVSVRVHVSGSFSFEAGSRGGKRIISRSRRNGWRELAGRDRFGFFLASTAKRKSTKVKVKVEIEIVVFVSLRFLAFLLSLSFLLRDVPLVEPVKDSPEIGKSPQHRSQRPKLHPKTTL
jgi:hypothetical protein